MSDACEMPSVNATSQEVREVLASARTVAVVGLSDKPDRDSYRVAAYLQRAGYRIVPVNPAVKEVLGEKAYASVREVPEKVDVVDVFRKAEAVPEIVEDAIAAGAKVVWLQGGIVNNQAAQRARDARLTVVQSRCMLKEHRAIHP